MKLYAGEENGIVVESSGVGSIFAEQYTRAHSIIDGMVKDAATFAQKKDRLPSIGNTPNIVAFCGDRGEGKTSCMESVVQQMKVNHADDVVFIDTIDPAFFDKEHNVIEILLGLMYRDFIRVREKKHGDLMLSLDNEIVKEVELEFRKNQKDMSKYFQDARQCLREMYEAKDHLFDPLEELTNMVQGVSLHEKIEELFEHYLMYCSAPGKSKKAIVIRIDDTDLNMGGAYEMLEKIRIYLNNPFCIILMSTKLEQLQKVVADGLGNQIKNSTVFNLPEMAMRYIIKVIPIGRQIHMPKVYSLCDEELLLYKSREDKDGLRYPSVKDAVVRLIFNKTRFLFYNSRGSVSPIIPNNLRSFRHLVGMLYCLDEFDTRETSKHNMGQFIHYFYQTWTEQLDEDKREFAASLIMVQDIISLNKIVINKLQRFLTDEQKTLIDQQDILNSNVANYNVSLGDVFYVLDVMDKSNTDTQLLLFTFFIRSYYSIKLYETYDKLTDGIKKPVIENNDGVGEIYRTDQLFKRTSLLQRLVNGSYFTYQPKEVLPAIAGTDQARDFKVIDGRVVNRLARKVRDILVSYERKKITSLSEEDLQYVKMLEFFALTLRKYVTAGQVDTFYRKHKDLTLPMHLAPFTPACYYYVMDVLQPFVSIIDVEAAYNRFSLIKEGLLYKFAINNETSLLRGMMQCVKEKEVKENLWDKEREMSSISDGTFKYHRLRLASNISIRNGEVLSAVFEGIKSRRFATYTSSNNTVVLSEFYRNLTDSKMHTYPRSAEFPAYTIQFSCLNAISRWLRNQKEESFNDYFIMLSKKEKSQISSGPTLRKNKEEAIAWAKEYFSELKIDYNRHYTRDEVAELLKECGYEEDFNKVKPTYWNNTFKTKAAMNPDTIYYKLSMLRQLFEAEINMELATEEDIRNMFKESKPE